MQPGGGRGLGRVLLPEMPEARGLGGSVAFFAPEPSSVPIPKPCTSQTPDFLNLNRTQPALTSQAPSTSQTSQAVRKGGLVLNCYSLLSVSCILRGPMTRGGNGETPLIWVWASVEYNEVGTAGQGGSFGTTTIDKAGT